MINLLSSKVANSLSQYDDMPETDVMFFSIKLLITNILTAITIIILGLVTDNFTNVLIAALSFSILRMFSGGIHVTNPELCIVMSTMLMCAIGNYSYLVHDHIFVINIVSLIMVALFSPSRIKDHSLLNNKYHFIFKIIAIILIICSFVIGSDIITVSMFVQSLTLIRSLKGGE